MSIDFSIRPVTAPAIAPSAHAASPAAQDAVATELPASQSVTALDSSNLPSSVLVASGQIAHQAVIDAAAASIVYQVVDTKSDTVIDQFPDEAALRRRAYFHALDLSRENAALTHDTDFRA